MLHYSRYVPRVGLEDDYDFDRALIDTVDHVRGHLSSCCDPDDDTENLMDDVSIAYDAGETGCLVTGSIDAEPDAPYLRDDYDPGAQDEYHEFTRYSEDGRE